MSFPVKNGQTSVVLRLKLLDSSSSVGAGLAGLASGTSGLIIATIADTESTTTRYTASPASIAGVTTLGTYSTPASLQCRFMEVDSTNHKGLYEFHFADARFGVSNAKSLIISVLGATNLAQADYVVPLVSDDPYVAKPTNYSTFSIDGSGRVDIAKIVGAAVDTTAAQIGVRVNNFNGNAFDSTAAQVGVRLVNIGAAAVDTTLSQLGVRVNNIQTAPINSVADGLLDRDMSLGTDTGSTTTRTVRQSLRLARNKFTISGGTLTVFKEDDTTVSWTGAVTTDSTASPVTANDPAG